MKGDFLALKYSGLTISSCYQKKDIIQLGWKCRKYQNWDRVQEGEMKADLLAFSDTAVEKAEIDCKRLHVVNQVLLNVNKWRLDKKNLSIEPEYLDAWGQAEAILSASIKNPLTSLDYLTQRYSLPDDFQFELAHNYLSVHLIAEIIQEACGVAKKRLSFSDLGTPFDVLAAKILDLTDAPYEVSLLSKVGSFTNLLSALDLPQEKFTITEDSFKNWEPSLQDSISYVSKPMGGNTVGYITRIKGIKVITLNTSTDGYKFAQQSEDMEDLYKKMIASNLLALEELSLSPDKIEDMQTLWAIKIKQALRS